MYARKDGYLPGATYALGQNQSQTKGKVVKAIFFLGTLAIGKSHCHIELCSISNMIRTMGRIAKKQDRGQWIETY